MADALVVVLWILHCTPTECSKDDVVPTALYGKVDDPIVVPYDLQSCTANAQQLAASWLDQHHPTHQLRGYGCKLKKDERTS